MALPHGLRARHPVEQQRVRSQALDVLRRHRDEYRVVALAAGRESELLREQYWPRLTASLKTGIAEDLAKRTGVFDELGVLSPHPLANVFRQKISERRRENWMPLNKQPGGSLSIYVPEEKRWEQFWIDSSGSRAIFTGGWNGKAMVITGKWAGPLVRIWGVETEGADCMSKSLEAGKIVTLEAITSKHRETIAERTKEVMDTRSAPHSRSASACDASSSWRTQSATSGARRAARRSRLRRRRG
jgi:hypothetical protein